MTGFASIFKREVKAYFSTPLAYVFLVIFLFFASFLTFQNHFYEARQATLLPFFVNMPLLFIFLVPAIAMRLWAEERRTNSIELLFSLPVTTTQAVLGKFAAAWLVMVLALALTFPIIITVCYLGQPDAGPIISGYIASILMAGTYLAIGGFFSALTRNQVIAFVLAVVACGLFYIIGSPSMLEMFSNALPAWGIDLLESFSFQSRFESLQRGVIELRDLAFFALLAVGWLWATVVLLQERRAAG